MKRHFFTLVAIIFGVTALATTQLQAQEPRPFPPHDHNEDVVCGGLDAPNLLQNPSFEGGYSAYVPPGGHPDCPDGTCNTAQMADGWTPYWRSHNPADPPEIIRMPEYKPAEASQDPPRTHHGDRAQQYFTFSSTHDAGFYQQVSVTPGKVYCFGIWGHAWSSSNDDAHTSDSELEQRIGIDPTGGTNWQSSNIIWGGARQYYNQKDNQPYVDNAFGPFTLVVRAEAPQMTVYTHSKPFWPVRHNDVYWDNAILLEAPEEPAITLSQHSFAIMEQTDDSGLYNLPVDISFAQDPGVIWYATADEGNTLDVTLWPMFEGGAAGRGDDNLEITFATDAYDPGSYSATITVTSDPAVPGIPATINVSLYVRDQVIENYLPLYRH